MKKRLIIIFLVVMLFAVGVVTVLLNDVYNLPILMYHSIDYKDKETKLSVSPESFERQMKFLYKNHYNVVSLDKAVSYLKKKEKIPPKTLAITFDDGFYNNYKYAYPILKKYNLPATIFMITDKIGQEGWLGWKELKEMSDSGLIIIGSHTKSHLWMPDIDKNLCRREATESKAILEKGLNRPVDLFCYPLGAFNKDVEETVKAAGYTSAVTTSWGNLKHVDVYAIKRIRISNSSDSLFVFWFETSGIYGWIKESHDKK